MLGSRAWTDEYVSANITVRRLVYGNIGFIFTGSRVLESRNDISIIGYMKSTMFVRSQRLL